MTSVIVPLTALHSLNLSSNEHLNFDVMAASMLRAMQKLKVLDVAKMEPALHGTASVQALFDLDKAHGGRRLLLNVNFDPSLSNTYKAETDCWGLIPVQEYDSTDEDEDD